MTYNQVQLFRINYLADQSFSHVNNTKPSYKKCEKQNQFVAVVISDQKL